MRTGAVGALAERIPLRPAFLDVAVGVERVETVLPDAAIGGVEHVDADRAREAREVRGSGLGSRVSPRCATKMRFGDSAKTPEFPPNAKPGSANGLCHPRTTSYGLAPTGPEITAFEGVCASSAAEIDTATIVIVIPTVFIINSPQSLVPSPEPRAPSPEPRADYRARKPESYNASQNAILDALKCSRATGPSFIVNSRTASF